ncbi:hypothetical protein [Levilactobacillus zymae]|uniref:hypothetical protein n=1 Tax=Levilactobacillus zymae TaxID=267363 RepID=UPI0028B27474|nr:hypothetical protein [Levilactobacillus zymae]MDT6979870.1 hypothetical protein [Levilactobacillus zymae]
MQVWLRTLHVAELGVALLDGGVLITMFFKGIAAMYVNVLPYLWALGVAFIVMLLFSLSCAFYRLKSIFFSSGLLLVTGICWVALMNG